MPIEVVGLADLKRDLRAAGAGQDKLVSKALRSGAVKVRDRARTHTPVGKTGRLMADGRAFSNKARAGVTYTLRYAPVQEFAHTYTRANPGGSGTNTLTINANKATPRFAYRAVNELAPKLMDEMFDQIIEALKLKGWFV